MSEYYINIIFTSKNLTFKLTIKNINPAISLYQLYFSDQCKQKETKIATSSKHLLNQYVIEMKKFVFKLN
jgi:hypothetical protein